MADSSRDGSTAFGTPGARKIGHDELCRFLTDIFRALGMSAADAGTVAETMAWADLRGGEGHGMSRLGLYKSFIEAGDLDPAARPQVTIDRPAMFVLDGHRCAGAVAMTEGLAEAMRRARGAGICVGLVRNTTHAGAIGRYALAAAEAGFAAIVLAAAKPMMAYHGAGAPAVATSPIAFAVPTDRHGPIVLDMATSVVAMGKIIRMRQSGSPIPEGWALTRDGEPTTDPALAATVLPVGGAKGSGLSLMFELLTSVLGSNPIIVPEIGHGDTRNRQNAMLVVLEIGAFRADPDFRRDADELADLIKSLPRQLGTDEILLPGERGHRVEAARRRDGIPVPPKSWAELMQIAASLGVQPPASIAS